MPMVEVSISDLERLSKISLSSDKVVSFMELMKAEIESIEGDLLIYEASHDRPDLFSAEGLARALSFLAGTREPVKYQVKPSGTYLDASNSPSYRPYAFMAIVKNVKLDEEAIKQLVQLQEKLHLSYGRNRELVSIGFYDLDKIRPPFKYLKVNEAEYIPLDHSETMKLSDVLTLTEKGKEFSHLVKRGEYPVLMDSDGRIFSFPPILNGEESRVTEATTNILIDVTGKEPYLMLKVLNVLVTSVAERSKEPLIESLKILGVNEELPSVTPQLDGCEIQLHISEIENLLGLKIGPSKISELLGRMGFIVEEGDISSKSLSVWVPPYRVDVIDEADIIEDIAISYGYNSLGTTLLPPTHSGSELLIERFARHLRKILLGMGLQEVVNFMMVDSGLLDKVSDEEYIKVSNPKMRTYSALRNSLTPSLLLTASVNAEKFEDFEVFEIGDVVKRTDNKFSSRKILGILLTGERYTLTDGLVIVKTLLQALGKNFKAVRTEAKAFIEGRTASIVVGEDVIGVIGEVHPEILNEVRIPKPSIIVEIDLSKLLNALS